MTYSQRVIAAAISAESELAARLQALSAVKRKLSELLDRKGKLEPHELDRLVNLTKLARGEAEL